ncbi:hypothetical protein [Brevibacterium sp. SMBL_HHYL_HB1]|uniref:hypothetical protein n=1 Tax=Brevibacterium sp. SMBL_HHYL_HB1 TaxID=2777556 RepID=UPI001BAC27F5|nr:hypothetical protein [Brevibacterium sp. SMBL_HHYL_HB1]QUL79905.1 hypothetical protein IG171_03390 [Brevibacterium sp. SMBL_HHYL_HB1]
MKLALMTDDGEVIVYENVNMGATHFERNEMTLEFEVHTDSLGAFGRTYTGANAKNSLIDFFGLKAIKKGQRIAQSAIRKGDLIRMVDHSEPFAGERDYKTLEYVAGEDGDGGYRFRSGEKFYLLDRPKPVLPDAPGSVLKVRVPGYGVQHIVLGKDGLWRGPNVKAHASQIQEDADVVEVVA